MRTLFATLTIGKRSMSDVTEAELKRFQQKCKRVGDCLLWQGHLDKDGYGTFLFRRASRRAHRVAMYLADKAIPDGYVVNHICRNRACVNHQHLQSIQASENWKRDSSAIGYINSQKTSCPRGHTYDRHYGGQRYCSKCEAQKSKRLRAKWRAEGIQKI